MCHPEDFKLGDDLPPIQSFFCCCSLSLGWRCFFSWTLRYSLCSNPWLFSRDFSLCVHFPLLKFVFICLIKQGMICYVLCLCVSLLTHFDHHSCFGFNWKLTDGWETSLNWGGWRLRKDVVVVSNWSKRKWRLTISDRRGVNELLLWRTYFCKSTRVLSASCSSSTAVKHLLFNVFTFL